jgi:hypothetical protein
MLRYATVVGSAALSAAAVLSAAAAPMPGDRVDDFSLLDHRGEAHQLYYLSDRRAVVIMADAACSAADRGAQRLEALRDAYEPQGVSFLLLRSNALRPDAAARAEHRAGNLPILVDETGIIGRSLGFEHGGEVLVVDPARWSLSFRDGDAARLDDVLDHLREGAPTPAPAAGPGDCALALEAAPGAGDSISYRDTIAPMLIDNCVACHRVGGIGPWPMTDYTMVRGFAPMIREVVRTRRMPPWHADPYHGDFANDRSLTAEQADALVRWVEAGAPRGDGADPLAEYQREWPEWSLGEPDVVIDIPAYEVPATGVVEYLYPTVANPLKRDVWVRAAEILPGSREALHHVITTFGVPDPTSRRGLSREGSLGGYVPGADGDAFPEGTGVLLPADAVIQLQMHYTTFGRAVTDRSRLGLYLHDEPPEHELQTTILMNPRLRIPPHARAHSESAETTLPRDILVYNLLPHAHYRGKASEFRAIYPDGHDELLLSVPNYDFNWQTTYELVEPKRLPAGTRLVHTTTWDNSAQNPANPDPDREVPWGQQSWDEMLFGAVRWRYADDEAITDRASGLDSDLAMRNDDAQ